MLKTVVTLGTLKVQIEAETIGQLLMEAAYIQGLDEAREGAEATPFHRKAGGYDYFGFRRESDGAEVQFGKAKEAPKGRGLFAYSPSSQGYKGWQIYDPETRQTRPAPHPGNGGGGGRGGQGQAPASAPQQAEPPMPDSDLPF